MPDTSHAGAHHEPPFASIREAVSWGDLLSAVEEEARAVGAAGYSLGVIDSQRVDTYNRGFADHVNALYLSIALSADLPGPATARTRQPQYFSDRAEAEAEYPKVAPILAFDNYSAAACLPLPTPADRLDRPDRPVLGYLALHYRDSRLFPAAERAVLDELATVVADKLAEVADRRTRG